MSITDELKGRTARFLEEYGIGGSDTIQVGFSGGPDSVVLFHLLISLRPDFGYSLYGLYVDHGIRPSGVMDEECVRVSVIAAGMGGEIRIHRIPGSVISTEAYGSGSSVEETARRYRYAVYREYMEKYGASYTALAHTLDDSVETIIMRGFQGSGVHGLKGILPVHDGIIRPLLSTEKDEIYTYIEDNGLEYVYDETNGETVYLRNRIRHILLPAVKEVFPGYKRALLSLGRKMEMTGEYLERSMGDLLDLPGEDGDLNIGAASFGKLLPVERMELLYSGWEKWKDKPSETLRFKTISSVVSKKQDYFGGGNRILISAGDFQLVQTGGRILWKRLVVNAKKSYLRVITSGEFIIYPGLRIKAVYGSRVSAEEDIWLRPEKVESPLIVRSGRPGDHIGLKEGRKTLKKLFGQWRVPPEDRWRIPVLEDRSGILAVIGGPLGFKNRVAERHRQSSDKTSKETLIIKAYMEY